MKERSSMPLWLIAGMIAVLFALLSVPVPFSRKLCIYETARTDDVRRSRFEERSSDMQSVWVTNGVIYYKTFEQRDTLFSLFSRTRRISWNHASWTRVMAEKEVLEIDARTNPPPHYDNAGAGEGPEVGFGGGVEGEAVMDAAHADLNNEQACSDRSRLVAEAGVGLAEALWGSQEDPLGQFPVHYHDIATVPSSKFSNSTEYFQMVVDDGIPISGLVTTNALGGSHQATLIGATGASARLARTSVIWCVVADGIADKASHRYPILMTRNVIMNTLTDDIRIVHDVELGLSCGIIIDNHQLSYVVRDTCSSNSFDKNLTNRVLRP